MVSIIIATRNRENSLVRCLDSIQNNNLKNTEVIVVDQSSIKNTINISDKYPLFKYYKLGYVGKSKALNFAIKKSKGDILAFTDDDCITTSEWVSFIQKVFTEKHNLAAVFGQTLPVHKNNKESKICVSCHKINKEMVFNFVPENRLHLYGNCMVIKKTILNNTGLFKEWLGVGSIGQAAEEEELVFRLLKNNYKILLYPKLVVYHDHWLNRQDYNCLMRKYSVGYFAAFVYHLMKGDKMAATYLNTFIKEELTQSKRSVIKILTGLHAKEFFKFIGSQIKWLCYIYGSLIGVYYALKNT